MTNAALKVALEEIAALKLSIENLQALHREILRPKIERLEELKTMIGEAAEERPKLANATAGGGRSWSFPAGDSQVRVTQPAPKLVTSIDDETTIEKLRALCGRAFNRVFVPSYKRQGDTKKWRELVFRSLKEKAAAEKVIALCEIPSASSVTVS